MKKLIAFLSLIILPCAGRAAPAPVSADTNMTAGANIFIKANGQDVQPYAALCSVHAYNIGEVTNPSGELKATMDNVVALKTTLLTMEMKRQYDMLDSTIKRLQTQLEKAMLVAKLQAAGASTSDGTSGGASGGGGDGTYSTNRNTPLTGAEDCSTQTSLTEMLNCLQRNYSRMRTAYDARQNMMQVNQQIAVDAALLLQISPEAFGKATTGMPAPNPCAPNVLGGGDQTKVLTCLNQMNIAIMNTRDNKQNAAKAAAARTPGES